METDLILMLSKTIKIITAKYWEGITDSATKQNILRPR